MSATTSIGVDAVLEALADSRRRHALSCLRRHDELALADLADEVAVRESGGPIRELPAEQVSEVYFSLYHTHVPKLEAVGLVRYHQERDLVTCRGRIDEHVRRARQELDALAGG